ncbi:Replicative DNA helicase (DnaB) (plasmid) [Euzebya pacifica]|uniref:Replicative DNA helicase (DnaB) n=1 Tax=Euzebya pacifica TaxID=1608957 RepID=A0A346Y787_9ACTN|nr:LAGLIDADG family homing endonuclease [Euzebya pacifica]AXV10334.1 Replicative DNA helicase (DnaB) [Euzebya pacifica]
MAVRKPPNPWSEKQVEIGIAVVLLVGGIWFRLPGVGAYLATAVFVRFGWPKPEEIYDIEGPGFVNAGKAQLYAAHLMQPLGAKAWFGGVGPDGNSWWPPIRISAWWAFLAGLTAGLTELLVMAATGIAMPHFAIDTLAVFLLAQAVAAGSRDAAYADFQMQGTFPAAVIDADVIGRLGTTKIIWAPLATAIAIAAVGTVATIRVASGIDGFALSLPIITTAWVAIGLLTGASIGARRYIIEFAAPQREFLTNAQLWGERWMSVRLGQVPPPQYAGEFSQPPEGNGEETHKMAIFQVPAGGTIAKYKDKTEELMSAVATEPGTGKYVLVAPMPDTDPGGQPVPGSRNEQQFKVVWNTVPLPAAPHLAGDLDNWTLAYAIHQAFDRAFNALKLGMPDLVRPIPLVRTADRALFETIWNLPQGTTYEKVMKQAEAIAEKIDAPWLRIGRRTHDSDGRVLPDTAISICFGHHPDTVEVDPKTRAFLEALDLHAAFYALKLGAPVLEEAVRLTKPGRPAITEAKFRLSASIDWAAVSKKTAALAEKIEVDYLRITRRDDPSGNPSPLVSVIYGCHPSDTVMLGDPAGYNPDEPLVGPETNSDRLFLDALDWDDYFRACGLVGSDRRSPAVISKTVNKQGVASYECRTVPGLPISDLVDGVEALKATSGLGYVEIESHPKDAALFKLLAAKIDPLDRPYLAIDYANGPKPNTNTTVLHAPVPGVPDIDWAVGPGAEGDLLIDKWEGDNPHLFIGGACLSPDTLVRPMGQDPVPIGDLVHPGHDHKLAIRTGLPDGRLGWAGSTHAGTVRRADAWSLRLIDGRQLTGSPDHPVWTPTGWRGLATLRHGDMVATEHPDGHHGGGTAYWTPVKDVAHVGVMDLYDLTVSSTHNYLANGLVAHNSGSGKALALDTPIPSPDGWTTMGELRIGDRVYDDQGQPCAVVGLSPIWQDRPCFEVTFDDGTSIVADAAHEWVVQNRTDRKAGTYRKLETRDLHTGHTDGDVWSIDLAPAAQADDVDLPIDPYLLGVLLGDGDIGFPSRQWITSADPEIIDHVRRVLPDGMDIEVRNDGTELCWQITWPERDYRDNDANLWLREKIGVDIDTGELIGIHDPDEVLRGAIAASPAYRGNPVTSTETAARQLAAVAEQSGRTARVQAYTGRGGATRYEVTTDDAWPTRADGTTTSFLAGACLAGLRRGTNGGIGVLAATTRLIQPHLPDGVSISRQRPGFDTGYLTCDRPKQPSPLRQALAELGLSGTKSHTKFIPDLYMRGSADQRLALLQGLMDTDGHVDRNGRALFGVVSERLARGVLALARSLGAKATITTTRSVLRDHDYGPVWIVGWTSCVRSVRLARKAERLPKSTPPIAGRRWVRSVEAVDRRPTRCIEVDAPSHVFLSGEGLVPSMNSITTLWMLLQLMHNNDPADVKFALADPKTELVYFEDAAHVNHFLGLTTPGFMANPYGAMADLLEHLKEETYRRNQSFTMHPAKPQKLTQARFIARQEIAHAHAGTVPDYWPAATAFPWWDGPPEAHPFMLPYQFIIIEECSTFFKKPANKEQHGDWERLIGHVEEMARIARSAGMHIAAMTQYPKKENIPTTLLAQCRRIGLSMNRIGSMLTIEESGLQGIKTPGRGKMSYGKSYKGVRCLFVRAPDEKDPDAPNDRDMFFEPVPKDGESRVEVGGRLPGTTGPTVVAAPPPDPSGVWLPTGGRAVMPGAVAPSAAQGAAQGRAETEPVADGRDRPEGEGGDAPDWGRPDEEYPDLDELLADLG